MERKGRRFTLPPLARIHAGAHDSTVTVATSACTLKNWQIASVNSTVRELAANWRKGTKSAKSWSTGRQSSVCILVYTALESTAPSLYAATTRRWVIFSSASRCTVQIRGSVLLTSVSTMPGWDRSHCGFSCMYYEHLYSPRIVGEIKEKKLEHQTNKQWYDLTILCCLRVPALHADHAVIGCWLITVPVMWIDTLFNKTPMLTQPHSASLEAERILMTHWPLTQV